MQHLFTISNSSVLMFFIVNKSQYNVYFTDNIIMSLTVI